ncbi:unnamed protein product [Dibothriocephalus latus]|uniref:Dynein regulatory complex protein 9 n=1 Tax=Dibothriocephalus latus TaxID=60516 RepID=A0A3P6TU42_DIBLA|nr:unnamed protein product [Dibothriocephalus latus]
MTLYGADAIALSAVFHDVATEFDLLSLVTRPTLTQNALQESNNSVLRNYLAEPTDLNQHFDRVLQKCGSVKKSKRAPVVKSQQENLVTKWSTMEDGLETYLYERKVKEIREHGLIEEISRLKEKLKQMREETEETLKQRNEIITHLQDQFQELKFRAAMETKYIQKCTEVVMKQTEGKCRKAEEEIREETRFLRNKLAQDTRCHVELFSWLTNRNAELSLTCDYMAEKETRDVSAKQEELAALTKKKEDCLNNLKALIVEYEHVEKTVLKDRKKKEKKRKEEEKEKRMLDSAQMIQNWWRTMIVMHDIKLKKKRRKDTKKAKKSTKK